MITMGLVATPSAPSWPLRAAQMSPARSSEDLPAPESPTSAVMPPEAEASFSR